MAPLESVPENATHWSRAKMAERTGLSKSTTARIRKAFELKPHLVEESFKLSTDPLPVQKARGVVGLHLNPPEAVVVLGVDQNSRIQALPGPGHSSR